ncbi:MAG: phosphate acyltransferase PlsX [Gammaproteobacteria bacterium]
MFSIAVDAMSGENDPQAAVQASLRMARENPEAHFIVAGKTDALTPLLAGAPPNISAENADETVAMDEPPSRAIRRRKTSMWRALSLVAEGRADAAVSAGNTGTLLGMGMLAVGAVQGIQRPAIASFMPNRNLDGGCCLLDLGANMECSAEMLRQFALMGSALVSAVRGVEKPRVGLLNVGEENFKGGSHLQQTAALLQESSGINFAGNVEGFDIYLGDCDVIVCDGFTGNVALKTSEGLARMISGMIQSSFRRDALSAMCGVFASPVLARLRRDMDVRRYNGACMLGMRRLVVKSHGNADAAAFYSALNYAARAGRQDLSEAIAAMPSAAPSAA